MDSESGVDLLSDLPESIMENILMLLPISDLVRTSILSSSWRYRWASIPQLVFDHESVCLLRTRNSLENFITHALASHKGSMHKFILSTPGLEKHIETDQWFLFLSKKDIKELFIKIENERFFPVPSRVYSCQNLTHLELYGCRLLSPPPTFKGFSFLRSLHIQCVVVSSDAIESIVSNSPLLESFTCEQCVDLELRIGAPNLKQCNLLGRFKEIWLDAPLLATMSILLAGYDSTYEQPSQKSVVCNYTKFFGGLPNLEKLFGAYDFMKYLSVGIESCHDSLVFHRLRYIGLFGMAFEDIKKTMVVVRLLSKSPNLFALSISCFSDGYASGAPSTYLWDSGCLPKCSFKQLKCITVENFHGSLHEMNLASKFAIAERDDC